MIGKKVVLGLGSGLVAGVLVALVMLNAVAPATDHLGASVGVKLVIEVQRADGTTERYVKEGDLILKNFAHLIDLLLMGYDREQDGEEKLTDTAGNIIDSFIDSAGMSVYNRYGHIHLGSGTTAPTVDDYALANELVSFDVQDVDITVNTTTNDMVIDVFGSYTADVAMNITEIGLSVRMYISSADHDFLLFRDVLANPIQLNVGDGITVHYYITLDNP